MTRLPITYRVSDDKHTLPPPPPEGWPLPHEMSIIRAHGHAWKVQNVIWDYGSDQLMPCVEIWVYQLDYQP